MASFRSRYAYPLMHYMLSHRHFKQRQMARELGFRHGESISGFVRWLSEMGFVEQTRDTLDRVTVYQVTSPLALVKFFSNFRRMRDLCLTLNMGDDREAAIAHLKENDGIFCLTSALEHYTEYVRDLALNVYVDEDYWKEMSGKEFDGSVRINLYRFMPYREDNITKIDGARITTRLRTLIDLYCDDKAYAAEPLVKQLWT